MSGAVEHRPGERRFRIELPEGEAELLYEMESAEVMDIQSTYVPDQARGRGIAGQLVEAAMGFAREKGYRVVPTCWYVGSWLGRHPEFRRLVRA